MSESFGHKLPDSHKEPSPQKQLDILLEMKNDLTDDAKIKNVEQLIKELLDANPELKKSWH